ncbi:hypothetical protein [Streptomyces sp. TRM68367]|uniref:hypothetical protein n=1 Tax=Streptomyces sp. TRM68367 TaxID=2758415 RepID=UPI00165C06FB|nr:hypothetical protein [Streptomyces sp. TRM68367]MBC9730823.1 hypothetical protein [Streptomyces sp. TRM68367]
MSSPTEPDPNTDTDQATPPQHGTETDSTLHAVRDTPADSDARISELTARIAELEQEKATREREDAIQDLASRYPYMTPEVLRGFGNVPTAELEERARVLSAAIHERDTGPAPGYVQRGRGGLDPSGSPRPTAWADAFRRAREQRRKGNGGVTIVSNSRHSGEL